MHPNPAFRSDDAARSLEFARRRGFGVLTLAGADGPLAAHLPFVVSDDGATLAAHVVRSNPVLRALAEPRLALVIVSGPDAYISPDWYEVEDQVPTWNYVAVHISGVLSRLPDHALRPHLEALSAANEGRLAKVPWTLEKMSEGALTRMMRMIVPVAIAVEAVDATWKLNQNKPAEVRLRAAATVPGSPRGQDPETLATMMREAGD